MVLLFDLHNDLLVLLFLSLFVWESKKKKKNLKSNGRVIWLLRRDVRESNAPCYDRPF
jgi:hypothetical protein